MNKLRIISTTVILLLLCSLTLTSCGKNTNIMTYKDSSITSNMYSYWLSTYKSDFIHYYNDSIDSDLFWDSIATEGMTTEEYAIDFINKNIKYILIGIQLFREYGLKIPPEVTESINMDINEKIDYFGGRSDMNIALSEYGINIDILKDIYIAEEKLYSVYDYLYGENGIEAITEEDIDAYYKENYSRIQYIIIDTEKKYVYNEDGSYKTNSEGYRITEPMTEDEIKAKNAVVDEIMMCVNAGDDFSEISMKYNEVDMSEYPNGFYVSPNELNLYGFTMIYEISKMSVGEIRKITDSGVTYIVQKCPLIERSAFIDGDTEQMENLENYCIQQSYEEKFSKYAEEVEVDEELLKDFSIRTASPNSYF